MEAISIWPSMEELTNSCGRLYTGFGHREAVLRFTAGRQIIRHGIDTEIIPGRLDRVAHGGRCGSMCRGRIHHWQRQSQPAAETARFSRSKFFAAGIKPHGLTNAHSAAALCRKRTTGWNLRKVCLLWCRDRLISQVWKTIRDLAGRAGLEAGL